MVSRQFGSNPGVGLFGVFCGDGGAVSAAAAELPSALEATIDEAVESAKRDGSAVGPASAGNDGDSGDPISAALAAAFMAADRVLMEVAHGGDLGDGALVGGDATDTGDALAESCHAAALLLVTAPDGGVLYSANVGGCHAVMCTNEAAFRLSTSHGDSRSLGGLGHALPAINRTELRDGDAFAVVASDEVWAVLADQPAVDVVSARLAAGEGDAQALAAAVVAEARRRGAGGAVAAAVVLLA